MNYASSRTKYANTKMVCSLIFTYNGTLSRNQNRTLQLYQELEYGNQFIEIELTPRVEMMVVLTFNTPFDKALLPLLIILSLVLELDTGFRHELLTDAA